MSAGWNKRRIVFVYANDPEPILLERMSALERTGRYEVHAVYWHRLDSPLSIPWSTNLAPGRFHRIDLQDPRGSVARRLFLTIRFVLRLRKLFKDLKPETVTAIYPDMLFATKMALLGRKSIPLMYELWDVVGPERPSWVSRFALRRVMKGLRTVFITADSYGSRYLRPNRLVADTTRIVYASNSPAAWNFKRSAAHDSDKMLTVSYIGQIRVAKQVRNLLGAVEQLRASGVQIRLLVAGRGEDSDWIEALSRSKDHVEYRGAFDFQRDMESLYSETDVMFAVYPQDQFNYQVHWARRAHQAILSGIPLIVAEGSEMAGYVVDNRLGWAVDADSQSDLESLLRHLANSTDKLSHIKTDSEDVLREHRFETFEEDVVAEYDSLFD